MRADCSYQCNDCGELLTHVTQGACPICGSHAVLPLGWFQISIRERKDWLQRIRGLRRKPQASEDPARKEDEPEAIPK
jgi:anaerobic ribonucleoside-triphosphate reductase